MGREGSYDAGIRQLTEEEVVLDRMVGEINELRSQNNKLRAELAELKKAIIEAEKRVQPAERKGIPY